MHRSIFTLLLLCMASGCVHSSGSIQQTDQCATASWAVFYQNNRWTVRQSLEESREEMVTVEIALDHTGTVYRGLLRFGPHTGVHLLSPISPSDRHAIITVFLEKEEAGVFESQHIPHRFSFPISPEHRSVNEFDVNLYWETADGHDPETDGNQKPIIKLASPHRAIF